MTYADLHQRSIQERDTFWREQASRIDWQRQPEQICDTSQPPFARWFAGGTTNLCHNAVDRHVATRGDQAALIFVSTETGSERTINFRQLLREVETTAAMLHSWACARVTACCCTCP